MKEHLYLASVAQRARVLAVLSTMQGPENARGFKEIARLAGVSERFCRDAYAQQLDGDQFVIGKVGDGLFLARDKAEAEAFDSELWSKFLSLSKRIRARRNYWRRQSQIKQLEMFQMQESA